jgi:predicted RNase H-like HicB family nuclease
MKEHPDQIRHPLAELTLITDGETVFRLTDDRRIMQDILSRGQLVSALAIKPLWDYVRVHLTETTRKSRQVVEFMGRKFRVVIEPDVVDGGFIAECRALRGCVTDGETPEEALLNIREAIADWLAADKEQRRARAQ